MTVAVEERVPDVRPRALWGNADFLLLWSGQAVSTLGSTMSRLALPLLALALTPDALQGRVNGVARLLALAGLPAGTALGGVLLGPLRPRVELWLVALGLGLSALAAGGTELRRS